MESTSRHQCMIYSGSPERHLQALASIARQKLEANTRCLYLHNPSMVNSMRAALEAAGVNVAQELERGALSLSSAQDHLVDGRFDIDGMLQMLKDTVDTALSDGFDGVWASGDMAWEFGSEKNFARLLEYEHRLEDLFERLPALAGVCQYNAHTLPQEAIQWGLCTHRAIFINETLSRVNPHYAPVNLLTRSRLTIPHSDLEDLLARPPLAVPA